MRHGRSNVFQDAVALAAALSLLILGAGVSGAFGPAVAAPPGRAADADSAPRATPTPTPAPAAATPTPPPAEPPSGSATPTSPAATPTPSAPAPPSAEPPPVPLPRIVRTVCTDRICGNCDGKCHKNSGHVAVDKKGHCACTPTEGSPLDRATRQAYERNQPQ